MSPEDVARRHEEMPGFELVDYAEIALPIWQLSLEAVSIAHRKLPPIQEFALRAVAADLAHQELCGFLGLDGNIIDGALAQLAANRLVRVSEADTRTEKAYALTEEGARALLEEGVAVPVEDQFQVFFDGIHRQRADRSRNSHWRSAFAP